MIRQLLNRFNKKKTPETEKFPVDKEAPQKPETEKKKGFAGIFDKYINYVDNLLGLISIWGAIILFAYVSPNLPELQWPYYLDELLFLILLYVLVDITVKKLRPVVFIALIIGSTYVLVQMVLDIYQDSINKTVLTNNQNISIKNGEQIANFLTKLTGDQQPVLRKLDSLQQQNTDLKNRLMTLENKQDSLAKKLKTIKPAKKK